MYFLTLQFSDGSILEIGKIKSMVSCKLIQISQDIGKNVFHHISLHYSFQLVLYFGKIKSMVSCKLIKISQDIGKMFPIIFPYITVFSWFYTLVRLNLWCLVIDTDKSRYWQNVSHHTFISLHYSFQLVLYLKLVRLNLWCLVNWYR